MAGAWRITVDRAAANAVARAHATRIVTDVTRATLNRATIGTPVDSGHLRSKNMMRVDQQPTRVVGEVYNGTRYAATVHDGAKPHTIRARRKKMLRFKVGGKTVYAKSVRHPGTRSRPWLYRALVDVATPAGFVVVRR